MLNKKLLIIIGVALVVIFVAVGAIMYFSHNSNSDLPSVKENEFDETQTPVPSEEPETEVDASDTELPPSDDEGQDNILTEEELEAINEPDPELDAYEEAREDMDIPELSEEERKEIKEIAEQFNEPAGKTEPNSEVQEETNKPTVEETETTPQPDKNGYIYTKEQAIELFRTEFQKQIDNNGYDYECAHKYAIEDGNSTEEEFQADLKQLMTDPYSSEKLSRAFEGFRESGDMSILVTEASMWLLAGGDDAEWTECRTD